MLNINLETGLLDPVLYLPSTHCDERPPATKIELIVIHNISLPPGQFGTNCVERFFCGQLDFTQHPYFSTIAALRVSSHLFIKRTGEIIQFVPLHKRAWHAGVSSFQGKTQCNDFSIGIELEGTDEADFEDQQYQKLTQVITAIQASFPAITNDRITGHSDIAPGRKTDPGPRFNWQYLKTLLLRKTT